MKAQIVSEFRKLTTTRSAYLLLGGLLLVVGLVGAANILDEKVVPNLGAPLERQPYLLIPLAITTTFTMILGIRSFTDEFRHGSIVPTLLASPDRRRVLGAKLVAVGAAGAVYAAAAMVVGVARAVIALEAKGGDVTWSVAALAHVGGNLIIASALWAAIGVAVGLAVRHQTAAIVGVFVWGIVVEGAVGAILPAVGKFLPDAASSAIVGVNAEDLLAPGPAVLVFAAWTVAAAIVAARLMQRRDVA